MMVMPNSITNYDIIIIILVIFMGILTPGWQALHPFGRCAVRYASEHDMCRTHRHWTSLYIDKQAGLDETNIIMMIVIKLYASRVEIRCIHVH